MSGRDKQPPIAMPTGRSLSGSGTAIASEHGNPPCEPADDHHADKGLLHKVGVREAVAAEHAPAVLGSKVSDVGLVVSTGCPSAILFDY